MSLFEELKRRNVVRVGLLYAVGGWVVLQVADVLAQLLGLPDWTLRFVAFILVLGFPLVLIFSWVFELTPEGIKRESDLPADRKMAPGSARKFNLAIAGLAVIAVLIVLGNFAGKPADSVLEPGSNQAATTVQAPPGYSVSTRGDGSEAVAPATSIAVLPFVNMSSDPENDYFADGLSEELLNVLAQIEGFKVAGRTSSFSYKGKNENLKDIGQTLNVGTVLEGSVRKSGDQVRVTAQLISVKDGYHLWSNSYDRKLDDIFSIQDDIARQVVGALKKTLLASQDEVVLERRPTDNLEAYQLYLRGRHQLAKRTLQGLQLALAAFREATELDPEFARAWTGIADAQSLMASYGYLPITGMKDDAEFAIERALELDPGLGEAFASKGLLLTQLNGNGEDIIALYNKALELNPNNSLAHMWLAAQLGPKDPELALGHLRAAYAVDPLSRIVVYNLASYLMLVGQYEEAKKHTEELLELDPRWPGAQRLLAQNALTLGDAHGWIRANLNVLELDPDDTQTLENLGNAFLSLGDLETAEKYILRARKISPDYSGTAGLHALLLWLQDDPGAGLKIARDIVAQQPNDKMAVINATYAEAYAGDSELVLDYCRKTLGEDPAASEIDTEFMSIFPPCIWSMRIHGRTDQARALANAANQLILQLSSSFDVWKLHFMAARIAAAAGERDRALLELDMAIQLNMPPLAFPLDPWLRHYGDDPGFKVLFDNLETKAAALHARLSTEGLTSGKRVVFDL